MEKTKVAISSTVLGPGGVETHVKQLSLALCSDGIDVAIYGTACHWSQDTVSTLQAAGVKIIVPPLLFARYPRLGKVVVVAIWLFNAPRHVASLYCIGAGTSHRILKSIAGKGIFTINHEIVFPPSADSPAADCIRHTDVSVANSTMVENEMKAICPAKTIKTIPFLTASGPIPPPQRRPPIGENVIHIGYLGRLEARKRPDFLVREWKNIKKLGNVGKLHLHVYGDDAGCGMLQELTDYVQNENLEDDITIYGGYLHGALSSILLKLDLVVLPSKWEGLPLVLVESMQNGVPFVATCAGGSEEFQRTNPDVLVTGIEWQEFVTGLAGFLLKMRQGLVDGVRLHSWVEQRYGFEVVWPRWREALIDKSRKFWQP